MSTPGTPPPSPPPPPRAPLPLAPFILLALMTLATLAGPLGIIWTLRGGSVSTWPPDRPVEWIALIGIVGFVLGLMSGCVVVAARARHHEIAAGRSANPRGPGA